jgi:dipeptidyl aminopeptidase/acylaminoacyl peptidase
LLVLLAMLALSVLISAAPSHAAVLKANGKIAFTSDRDGNDEIYVMNADGSSQTNLTNHPARDTFPAWSPDGSKIAFVSDRDGNAEIYVMNADGTSQTRLTNHRARVIFPPAWSPDASKLAFTSNRDGPEEIYIMNADGSGQINLTNNLVYDLQPTWSPDGNKLAFTRQLGNTGSSYSEFDVYMMNTDGSGQTRLTNWIGLDVEPSWSPNGSKLAFVSDRDFSLDIYVMNADGSGPTRLTNHLGPDVEPSWSPDGSKIAFRSYRDGLEEIYVMNADGTNQTNLTNNPASDSSPSWQPLPITLPNSSAGWIGSPCSVAQGALESNTQVHVFPERLSYVLPSDVTVDIPGTAGGSTTIEKGKKVDIYYIHADRVGNRDDPPQYFAGSVDFPTTILGAMTASNKLLANHSTLGTPATTYSNTSTQGLEGFDDKAWVEGSRRLGYDLHAYSDVDQIRVITEAKNDVTLDTTVDGIGAPCSVVAGVLEHDQQLRVFPERLGYVLPNDVKVDIPGTQGGEKVIKAGEKVDVYYVHADRVGSDRQFKLLQGGVTFAQPLRGVITSSNKLQSSHAALGAPMTTYSTSKDQGLENGSDQVTVNRVQHRLDLTLRVYNDVDQIRIITEAAP